jgi:hypothetical protein
MFAVQFAADDPFKKLFGSGVKSAPLSGGDVGSSFAKLFSFGINMLFVVAALFALVYMLWGAFDFITSAGESDKMASARKKMVSAVIGIILIIASLTLWLVLTRDILGIFGGRGGGIQLRLPTIRDLQSDPAAPSPGPTSCPDSQCFPTGPCSIGSTEDPSLKCEGAKKGYVCCRR